MSDLPTTEGTRVLIADDDGRVASHLCSIISEIDGATIVGLASNGREGLQLFNKHRPQIVILDFSMPHLTGLEVLQEIRRSDTRCVVIMFTAHHEPSLRDVCLNAGADHFFAKMNDADRLVAVVSELIRNRFA